MLFGLHLIVCLHGPSGDNMLFGGLHLIVCLHGPSVDNMLFGLHVIVCMDQVVTTCYLEDYIS